MIDLAKARHILVVDDDPKIRLLLRRCFEAEGYRVSEAGSAAEAIGCIERSGFDLLTLDLSLPDKDGLTVAREVRARSAVPIIMVTGKGETIDRVVGLELGADDYIAKPFHPRELVARVRAVLRRAETSGAATASRAPAAEIVSFGTWHLDVPKRELTDSDGRPCELTTSEFELLRLFTGSPQRVLSRDQIMDRMKGHDWTPTDRTIDNLVMRLRRKIEPDPKKATLIKSVRGVGYTFTAHVRRKD
jgi:DNA-binding response OmpR family regulator